MRSKGFLRAGGAYFAMMLAASPLAGMAQEAPETGDRAEDAETAQRKDVVEERAIVVSGSRFQKLLESSQSKAVITAEQRNLAGVGTARQLLDIQPGFNFTEDFGINVRGVGRQTAQTLLGQENTVIQYVDGFINLVPSNIAESTLFGGNVQFTRGPAGTTYGRNALAGAINVQSRAPTPEFVGQAQVGIGREGAYNYGMNISGPITDNLGFRLGAQRYITPSIMKNLAPGSLGLQDAGFAVKNLYVELQLEWRIGGFHIRNRSTTFRYSNQPGYPTMTSYNSAGPVFGGLSPNPQYGYTGPTATEPYQINVDTVGYDRLRDNFQTITNADLDLGFATLYYVGGYQTYVSTGTADRDLTSRSSYAAAPTDPFAPGTIVPTQYTSNYENDNHFWSQEARLESKPGSRLSWILGAYYFNQHFNEHYWEAIPGADDVLVEGGGGGTIPGGNPLKAEFEQRNIYDIRSTALFGNVTYDITDTIRFDGGLRHTWDEKEALTDFRYIYYYPPFYASDVSPAVHSANPFRRDRGLSGRAALAWRPSSGDQLYLSYSRGYQSSAFTLGQGLPPYNISDSQHLDVYEIGGNYTSGGLRFDGSIFYQKFHDMQIPISSANILPPVPPRTEPSLGPVFSTFTNARLAEIYGAEMQVTWRPNVHSNIVATYTYLHPTFKSFCPPVVGSTNCGVIDITQPPTVGDDPDNQTINPLYFRDLSGNEVPRTPRNKASLYGYYGFDLGSSGYLYPGGSVTYQSGYYTDAFNRNRVGGRTVVGLTLTYRTRDERLDITGTVSNLFRKIYSDNSIIQNVGGTVQRLSGYYGPDRYWTVTGRYRF